MVAKLHSSARVALAAALVAASFIASAAEPTQAQSAAVRQACRADYEKVCAAVPPGGAPALECLKQHILKVSQPCQASLAAIGPGSAPIPKAPDLAAVQRKALAGTPTQQKGAAGAAAATQSAGAAGASTQTASAGGVLNSAAAPSGVANRPPENGEPSKIPFREEVAIAREACGPEYRQYCAMVRPGGGRAIACLAANDASLTPACKKVVAEAKGRM
jgi:hypothetical protein